MLGDLYAPVGTEDTVGVVEVDNTRWGHVPRDADAEDVRVRRHLFISSDIRIKAFTFNQN